MTDHLSFVDFQDSFESTGPFDFGAAQYFVPMTSLLGSAIAATFVGGLSDKIGRRPVMLVCVGMGVLGSIAKYFVRRSFWGFCAANFITGLFGATLAISLAYASDVAHTRVEKDLLIGSLVGLYMVGNTGGGIMAIAMENTGLFAPLFVGAAMNLIATIFSYFVLIEPNKMLHIGAAGGDDDDDDDGPKDMDWKIITNILAGSLADNAGSVGLFPLCLSPLAFNTFLTDFQKAGKDPLMTAVAYKWIATLVALMIVPASMCSSKLYEKIGAAG
jgi:MFS family permease